MTIKIRYSRTNKKLLRLINRRNLFKKVGEEIDNSKLYYKIDNINSCKKYSARRK